MNIEEFARLILLSPHIHDKISARVTDDGGPLLTPRKQAAILQSDGRPARPAHLKWRVEGDTHFQLPATPALQDAYQRGLLLHYFANHELLAIELMALALIRFPEAPLAFKRGLVKSIYDEQLHLQLYLNRMAELGVELGALTVNDHFWRNLVTINSPLDFVVRMSLTFEQANLDFASYYERLFREIDDEATADILARVLEDEIAHVAHGAGWFMRWQKEQAPERSAWDFYCTLLPAPLTASRAKGPVFNKPARLRAGLPLDYIERLQVFQASKSRPPKLWLFNPACEEEWAAGGPGYSPPKQLAAVAADLAPLLGLLASPQDIVLCPRLPSLAFQKQRLLLALPAVSFQTQEANLQQALPTTQRLSAVSPWGWSAKTFHLLRPLAGHFTSEAREVQAWLTSGDFSQRPYQTIASKAWQGELAQELPAAVPALACYTEAEPLPRFLCHDRLELAQAVAAIIAQGFERAVLKAPYGASGRRHFLCTADQLARVDAQRWFTSVLERQQCVVVEPWLDKVCDLSLLMDVDSERGPVYRGHSFFITDEKGAYRGHILGSVRRNLSPELRRFLYQPAQAGQASLAACLPLLGKFIATKLAALGMQGPLGIDTLIYRKPGNQSQPGPLYFRPLLEVNPRLTMGHVALALEKRLTPGRFALWAHLSCKDITGAAGPLPPPAFCTELSARTPLTLRESSAGSSVSVHKGAAPTFDRGLWWTSEAETAEAIYTVLAVGDSFEDCQAMLAPLNLTRPRVCGPSPSAAQPS